ncbi:forkhead box protein I1 [Oryzias melastigma]|uniref:forkhead box protein I1 n=1 Tax=Oryzias melastigma TaxID=30732 RepID=UPI000CF7FCE5|nr:forkhead box protein I1 [Oryzias melastigma]
MQTSSSSSSQRSETNTDLEVSAEKKMKKFGANRNAYTYLAKIALALHDAPDQMLTFTQLIQKMDLVTSEGGKSVENNIRVCLSTHRCFKKIPVVRNSGNTKKNYWKLDSSQITTKMVRRHLKDVLHLFPELTSKVETESLNRRSGKQESVDAPVKFSSPFSIENLLRKDTTPAFPQTEAKQQLHSDHRQAAEKRDFYWKSEQILLSQTPAGSSTFWSTGGSASHSLNTAGVSQSVWSAGANTTNHCTYSCYLVFKPFY